MLKKTTFSQRWLFDNQHRDHQKVFHLGGTDEAGRGALAGPIVVAAIVLPSAYDNPKLRDSKKISAKERELLFQELQEIAITYSISIIDSIDVERLNPKQASKQGMKNCFAMLCPQPQLGLVDAEKIEFTKFPTKAFIKGDDLSLHIAAASILAKVTRDHLMVEYHQLYPEYNFAKNKGYGTKEHLDQLNLLGPVPIHRKTYRPVQDALASQFIFATPF